MIEATAVVARGADHAAGCRDLDRRSRSTDYGRIADFVHAQGAVAGHPARPRRAQGARPARGRGRGYVARGEGGWHDGRRRPRSGTTTGRRRSELDRRGARCARPALGPTRPAASLAGRFRRHRDPRGPRLPAAPVPVAAEQPPDRRVRRRPGRTACGCCSRSSTPSATLVPDDLPLFVRISAPPTGSRAAGTSTSRRSGRRLAEPGVDLIDVSCGGLVPKADPVGPGYQVPFARRIRHEAPGCRWRRSA